jgi:hypothetical protein
MSDKSRELDRALRKLLSSPVLVYLSDVDSGVLELVRAHAHFEGLLLLRSFSDVLSHPDPTSEVLEIIKQFGKDIRNDPQSELPDEVSTVLYYLAIAAARSRYGRSTTQLDDDAIRDGFRWVLRQEWVDASSKQLVIDALRQMER